MPNHPGSHIIASLSTNSSVKLNSFDLLKPEVDKLIRIYDLENLGEVYHNFSPGGFTAVVCLSESHLSIHTWPEYGKINLGIYLSNHLRTNDDTVTNIYKELIHYFEAVVTNSQIIHR